MKVIHVTAVRLGFRAHEVVRNLSRGKPHDPRQVKRVEMTLLGGSPEELSSKAALEMVGEAAAVFFYGGRPRTQGQPYKRGGRWALRYVVE